MEQKKYELTKWIDEDFNPNGTRVGFLGDDGFISAEWNDE